MSNSNQRSPYLITQRDCHQISSHSVIFSENSTKQQNDYQLSLLVYTDELQLHLSQRDDDLNVFQTEHQSLSSPNTQCTLWSDKTVKTSHVTDTKKLIDRNVKNNKDIIPTIQSQETLKPQTSKDTTDREHSNEELDSSKIVSSQDNTISDDKIKKLIIPEVVYVVKSSYPTSTTKTTSTIKKTKRRRITRNFIQSKSIRLSSDISRIFLCNSHFGMSTNTMQRNSLSPVFMQRNGKRNPHSFRTKHSRQEEYGTNNNKIKDTPTKQQRHYQYYLHQIEMESNVSFLQQQEDSIDISMESEVFEPFSFIRNEDDDVEYEGYDDEEEKSDGIFKMSDRSNKSPSFHSKMTSSSSNNSPRSFKRHFKKVMIDEWDSIVSKKYSNDVQSPIKQRYYEMDRQNKKSISFSIPSSIRSALQVKLSFLKSRSNPNDLNTTDGSNSNQSHQFWWDRIRCYNPDITSSNQMIASHCKQHNKNNNNNDSILNDHIEHRQEHLSQDNNSNNNISMNNSIDYWNNVNNYDDDNYSVLPYSVEAILAKLDSDNEPLIIQKNCGITTKERFRSLFLKKQDDDDDDGQPPRSILCKK